MNWGAWIVVLGLPAVLAAAACGDDDAASSPTDAGLTDAPRYPTDSAQTGDDGDTNPGDAGSLIDASGDASIDAGDWSEAGSCNTLIGTAPLVERMFVAQNLPTLHGGAFDPGTYELTSEEEFTGPGGAVGGAGDYFADTWVVTSTADAGLFDLEEAQAGRTDGGVGRGRVTETLAFSPGKATFDRSCPTPAFSLDFQYETSGAGAGATFKYTLGAPRIYTMTKQ